MYVCSDMQRCVFGGNSQMQVQRRRRIVISISLQTYNFTTLPRFTMHCLIHVNGSALFSKQLARLGESVTARFRLAHSSSVSIWTQYFPLAGKVYRWMRIFRVNGSARGFYGYSSLESLPSCLAPSKNFFNPIDYNLLRSRVAHVALPFHESDILDSATAGN